MERHTRQRQAVLDALADSGRTLTPSELLALARQQAPALNLSTVYRQLKSLEEGGVVLRVQLPGQPTRYEARCPLLPAPAGRAAAGPSPTARLRGAREARPAHAHASRASDHPHDQRDPHDHPDHHHHHFHCVVCDEVVPIHGCPGPMHELAPPGCEVERHDLVLHGRCARCAGSAAEAGTAGSLHTPAARGAGRAPGAAA